MIVTICDGTAMGVLMQNKILIDMILKFNLSLREIAIRSAILIPWLLYIEERPTDIYIAELRV